MMPVGKQLYKGLQMRLLRNSHKYLTGQEGRRSHADLAVKNIPVTYFYS